MKELQIMAKRVLLSLPVEANEDGCFSISRATRADDLAQIQGATKEELELLIAAIEMKVPDDVSWTLIFDKKGTRFALDYEDGNTGTTNGGSYYWKMSRLFSDLDRVDWDDLRGDALQAMDIFDVKLKDAAEHAVDIPSSLEASKKWAGPLGIALAELRSRQNVPEYAVIVARDDCGIATEECKDREDVLGMIGDRMTTGCDILAVMENCVELGFDAIELRKREAVEGLGPISRAKAERRFNR